MAIFHLLVCPTCFGTVAEIEALSIRAHWNGFLATPIGPRSRDYVIHEALEFLKVNEIEHSIIIEREVGDGQASIYRHYADHAYVRIDNVVHAVYFRQRFPEFWLRDAETQQ